MTCLGVLDRGERDKDTETDLKEGGGIEMSTTVLHSRTAPSLELLTNQLFDPLKSFRCYNCSLRYRNQLTYDFRLAWRWDRGRRKNHPCRNCDRSNIHETLCCSPLSASLPKNFLASTILQMHGRNRR